MESLAIFHVIVQKKGRVAAAAVVVVVVVATSVEKLDILQGNAQRKYKVHSTQGLG